jgi:hypothetical protein
MPRSKKFWWRNFSYGSKSWRGDGPSLAGFSVHPLCCWRASSTDAQYRHSQMKVALHRLCRRQLSTRLPFDRLAVASRIGPSQPLSLTTPHHGIPLCTARCSRSFHRSGTEKGTPLVIGEDSIFALSTASGRAAIAIIRISGPSCVEVGIFRIQSP